MQSVKSWKVWLMQQLLSEGSYIFLTKEQILREIADRADGNLDEAIKQLIADELLTLVMTGGSIRYGITIGKLQQAQDIANRSFEEETDRGETQGGAQEFIPDPVGYSYLDDLNDERQSERTGLYTLYYKKNDPNDFAARILKRGSNDYRMIYVGSVNNPNSLISRAWRDILEIVRQTTNATFTLHDLLQKDIEVCGSNKQRGRVLLAIFRNLGRIEPVKRRGNSVSYRITSNEPSSVVTMDNFVFPNENGITEWFNDPESLPELDELPEHDSTD